jgi:voltage-gated potassium channel
MQVRFNIYLKRFISLITSATFWGLTAICNLFILLLSILFFLVEQENNTNINELMDAVWWAFTTVTTVGYGDIVPTTFFGRLIGIFIMLAGTALFATFTALFANALLGHEFKRLGAKVSVVKHELEREDENIHNSIHKLQESIIKLQERLNKHEQ